MISCIESYTQIQTLVKPKKSQTSKLHMLAEPDKRMTLNVCGKANRLLTTRANGRTADSTGRASSVPSERVQSFQVGDPESRQVFC